MAALRTPGSGCPWDLEQNFATIAPYTLEEAYEVADAILRNDLVEAADRRGGSVVMVCGRQLRVALARFAEIANVRATVLAVDEVAPGYALAIEEGPAA